MSDSDLPTDSHPTPQEDQDGSEQAAPSPAAMDSDLNMDDGGGSDNESELSDVDEAAFADFDPNSVALADRPVLLDDEITRSLKASKVKNTNRESKKKEAKREKPKKKRTRDDDDDDSGAGGEEIEGRRSRKTKRTATGRSSRTDEEKAQAQKQREAIDEESMTPEQRRARALDAVMDAALKNPNKRRKKKDEVVSFYFPLCRITLHILTRIFI